MGMLVNDDSVSREIIAAPIIHPFVSDRGVFAARVAVRAVHHVGRSVIGAVSPLRGVGCC